MKYPNPINQEKIRNLQGSFAWIPHAFMRKGFWSSLSQKELLLYLFLVLVSDRHGMSYYSFDRICQMLKMHTDDYICARNELMTRELIAFDGYLFQVLSLPANPVVKTPASQSSQSSKKSVNARSPRTVRQIFQKMFLNEQNNS